MCDTMVIPPQHSLSGAMLFAKNSDRDPNEAQLIDFVAGADHPQPSTLKCTYIQIPQVAHTNSVLLSRPFWIWGAEMGTNDKGVVIGNEAVFTKIPHEKQPGLIGMDLLRLGLERGDTAIAALKVITALLVEYGQSGNCGFAHPFQYHNSFLIADRKEAWVLETAGRDWAAEKVQSARSISNALTIGRQFDLVSEGLVKRAVENRWCKNDQDFDFSRCYSDFLYTTFSDARSRHQCTMRCITQTEGKYDPASLMKVLGTHQSEHDADWSPDRRLHGADVCMHVGFGPIRINQTTGSMVSELADGEPIHWMTGTAAPCLSIFKPVWMDAGLPVLGALPTGVFDSESMWWEHEKLHRMTVQNYSQCKTAFIQKRDELQASFLTQSVTAAQLSAMERKGFSARCFELSRNATREWTALVQQQGAHPNAAAYYRSAWSKINREANFQIG